LANADLEGGGFAKIKSLFFASQKMGFFVFSLQESELSLRLKTKKPFASRKAFDFCRGGQTMPYSLIYLIINLIYNL